LIAEPLTYILNLSFQQGVVPSELKKAHVIPIHKGSDPIQFSNFRPISLLPVFSKMIERLLYNRLFCFFNSNNVL
uniref:Reverse transcriptase domain-containing protein n=1 Tax=Capitella teleta TaxID=283909 RepID=X1Z3Y3_CAPTE